MGADASALRMNQPPDDFVSRVLGVVDSIPAGQVMTYGDVAAAAGSRAARAVGQVMARYGADVAWWRVIQASGHPARGLEARALERLRAEGTPLECTAAGTWRVRLDAARHDPAGSDAPQRFGARLTERTPQANSSAPWLSHPAR